MCPEDRRPQGPRQRVPENEDQKEIRGPLETHGVGAEGRRGNRGTKIDLLEKPSCQGRWEMAPVEGF